MHSSKEEIKQIQRKLFILIIIDAPAIMLVGLGLAAVLSANGNAVPDLLNNKNIAYGVIVVGGVVMAWCGSKIVPLLKSLRMRHIRVPANGQLTICLSGASSLLAFKKGCYRG